MNLLQVILNGLSLIIDGYKQKKFIDRWLKPIVVKHCIDLNYELNVSEKKKILFYYPMYTVLACAQMYASLKGRGLSKEETKRLSLVAAMATLCDDLIDEEHFNRDAIFNLLSTNNSDSLSNKKAKLLIRLNNELKEIWNLSDGYTAQLKIALEWQSKSSKQFDQNIQLEEIIEICRKKNGYTSLLFASLIDEKWTEKELNFIYQSAIVGQLTNDSFDMYLDTQNDINTHFNKAEKIADTRAFFLSECQLLHKMVRASEAKEKYQKNTINRMSILHAFTLTALDQFQKTAYQYGPSFKWKNIPRKDMVIDMAKNSNRFKTVRYMAYLSRL
jgi:hypothetical protein